MPAFAHRLGVHVSIAGGIEKAVERAIELGCSAMQIFSRNPRGWRASPILSSRARLFREGVRQNDIDPVVVHTPYLLNLASGDAELHRKSIQGLSEDLKRAEQLGAGYVVTHLGSAGDRGLSSSRKQVVKALQKVLEKDSPVILALENSAGGGRTLWGVPWMRSRKSSGVRGETRGSASVLIPVTGMRRAMISDRRLRHGHWWRKWTGPSV